MAAWTWMATLIYCGNTLQQAVARGSALALSVHRISQAVARLFAAMAPGRSRLPDASEPLVQMPCSRFSFAASRALALDL